MPLKSLYRSALRAKTSSAKEGTRPPPPRDPCALLPPGDPAFFRKPASGKTAEDSGENEADTDDRANPSRKALHQTVTVILLQVFITRWAEKRALLGCLALGSLLFSLGLTCFAWGGHWIIFVLGMFILTLGEILAFPSGSLFIDRLAPEPLRGTYFGANSFCNIGPFIGPALGGWLLGSRGGTVAFSLIALLTACGILFYWMGYRTWLQRKEGLEKNFGSNPSLSATKAALAR